MTDDAAGANSDACSSEPGTASDRALEEGGRDSLRPDPLVSSVMELVSAIRDLVVRSPVSSEELLTAEQLGELFRLSPRTLPDDKAGVEGPAFTTSCGVMVCRRQCNLCINP